MPFAPQSLDSDTLRSLSRQLQKRSGEVLPRALRLNQAQELLARAFGHADWHAAQTKSLSALEHA